MNVVFTSHNEQMLLSLPLTTVEKLFFRDFFYYRKKVIYPNHGVNGLKICENLAIKHTHTHTHAHTQSQ